jgi:hypothetical protein
MRTVGMPPCICCSVNDGATEVYQFFQPGKSEPCAWAHPSCFVEFVRRHARVTPTELVCVICELNVPGELLHPLHAGPETVPVAVWVHGSCMADYW